MNLSAPLRSCPKGTLRQRLNADIESHSVETQAQFSASRKRALFGDLHGEAVEIGPCKGFTSNRETWETVSHAGFAQVEIDDYRFPGGSPAEPLISGIAVEGD